MLPQDPIILLSYVNTKLRDVYPSLDALCDDLEANRRELEDTLGHLGYTYYEDLNKFV